MNEKMPIREQGNEYDVLIIGGATSGSYFAKLLAEQGKRVLILEKSSRDKVGTKYDIFHIPKKDFAEFGVPLPKKGDASWGFEFDTGHSLSAKGTHPKTTKMPVVGLHMHEYVVDLIDWACSFGAEIIYNAEFKSPIYEGDSVCGARCLIDGEIREIRARLVADCSGIPSVVRRSLRPESCIEGFPIGGEDMFYVILRYVTYPDPKDYISENRGWLYYKTWEAPQPDPHGSILGIGANFSFEYAEKVWREFESKIELPKYELDHIERGFTPFRRPPYSFVDSGVIIMGDAACLTKPFNGEGVTSSWVQTRIAAKVVNRLLDKGEPMSRERLWPINVDYIREQGAKFASSLATVTGAIATNEAENNFFYEKDIIFSKKSFENMNDRSEMYFSTGDIIVMAFKMLGGLITGRLRPKTIKALLDSMSNGGKIKEQYLSFPESPEGFEAWREKTDALWKEIGTIADAVPESERC